jgi:hypothetical protein
MRHSRLLSVSGDVPVTAVLPGAAMKSILGH